ncbi:hypothetical protein BGX28_009731 [Mortierella sp. GBA30]|nr:hypothetical protein BGX28_009731 [Mortierella sp. GBA30]
MSTSVASHGPLPKISEGSGTLQLGALVFNGVDLLDVMGPMRIFGEESNKLNIKINFISTSLEPVVSSQQVKITPDYTLDSAPKMDLFFIPGGIGTRTYANSEELIRKVKARVEESTWTMTVCTGAGILAKTGLVDGYNMTTNKAVFEWPVSQGPNVNWIKRARWVQDGKFVSSSGVSAGIDAALFILSELTSMEHAEEVATEIEYTWHRIASEDPFADSYAYTRSSAPMSHHRWELFPMGNIPHQVLSILLGSLPKVPDPKQEVEALERQYATHDDRLSDDDDEEEEEARSGITPTIQDLDSQGHRLGRQKDAQAHKRLQEHSEEEEGAQRSWNVPDDEWEWSDEEPTAINNSKTTRSTASIKNLNKDPVKTDMNGSLLAKPLAWKIQRHLVVIQQLHHTPVISIKARVGSGRVPGEDEDEMTILHEGGKVVCIEGESLWVVLRLSSGSGRPARHKPTLSNGFSSSSSSSMYTSQATERFVSVGSKPMMAFYASCSSSRPLFSATSLATQMAARVTSAVFGFAKSIWGSSPSPRSASPAFGAASGASTPDMKRLSGQHVQDGTAGPYGPIYPSAMAPATEVPAVLWLSDSQRCIRHVSLAPAPPRGACYHYPSKLAAMTDSLGRVLLVDLEECEIIRMWKGLRGARCGWLQEERLLRVGRGSGIELEIGSEKAPVKRLLILYLVIYAPKRGTVEIYPARQGKRVGLVHIGLGWKICTTFTSPIGKPVVLDRFAGSPHVGMATGDGSSYLGSASPALSTSSSTSASVTHAQPCLAQCLLIGPTGEVKRVGSRLAESSNATSSQASNSLAVSPAISFSSTTTESIASRLQNLGTS